MTAEQRTQLVLRLLSKEEPAAQIARRAGVSEQTLYRWREEIIGAGQQAMNGRGAPSEQARALERLNAEVAKRDQVIGELTIANRVSEKLSGALSVSVGVDAPLSTASRCANETRTRCAVKG